MRNPVVPVVLLSSLLGCVTSPPQTAPTFDSPGLAHAGDPGLTLPTVLERSFPQWTENAMANKVQGTVKVECVVNKDGTVGDVRVVQSLDKLFGMDDQAIKAAKQWRFRPGRKKGKVVPVVVTMEFQLNLRQP